MLLHVKLLLGFGFLAIASVACANTITSTSAGGPWAQGSTWVGGMVPGGDDDVVIAGPVTVAGTEACHDLSVTYQGYLKGANTPPSNTLQVSGSASNSGTIDDSVYNFFLEVGGDLYNEGVWANYQTTVTGTSDRHISHDPAARFATSIAFGAGASGDLLVGAPLTVQGNVNVTGGRLVLQNSSSLTLDMGYFSGEMQANGNELRVVSWSYLNQCTLDDVVLVGEVEAAYSVNFTTRVTVMDTLQNSASTGGSIVTVHGDLINKGMIRNNSYGFTVFLYGDLQNDGSITCSQVDLQGDAVHHISMSPGAYIDADIFLPEFQPRTLVADTPVRFAGGLGLGVGGTLILNPGSSLQFLDFGGLGSGIVLAQGNDISISGTGAIGPVTIDQGVIAEQVRMQGSNMFTHGVTVTGTLESWTYAEANLTVAGLLRNEGTIQDGAHVVRITALGDVANMGIFSIARVTLTGSTDQYVGAGPGIAVPEFVLESNLQANSYQWYRDNVPLPGQTAVNLTLATVTSSDYGSYHCEGDGGEISRSIVIEDSIATTGVPGATTTAVLAQNNPNPFNPVTEISFSLLREDHVSLVVYDLAGRAIAQLLDSSLDAGEHRITWQPGGLASGTYLYRLRAGDTDQIRKCTLLK